jgi:hypothetical protein
MNTQAAREKRRPDRELIARHYHAIATDAIEKTHAFIVVVFFLLYAVPVRKPIKAGRDRLISPCVAASPHPSRLGFLHSRRPNAP